jgi:hypothetical protein
VDRLAFHLLFTGRFAGGFATVAMEPSTNPIAKSLVVATGIAAAVTRRRDRDRRGWLVRGGSRVGAREPGRRNQQESSIHGKILLGD